MVVVNVKRLIPATRIERYNVVNPPLPLEVLSFDPVNRTFYLAVDKETIEEAPAFEKGKLPRVDRQGLIDVYAAYGYTPYWKESRVEEYRRQW